MTTYIENRNINLNSDNAFKRNGDYLSNVYFPFVGLLKEDSDIRSVSVSIQNAQFPYSFYNVNVYNNILQLSVDANPPVTITFTRGNYNATTLITEIKNQLTLAGITDLTLAISNITGLLTFTKTTGSFTFYYSGSTCFKILGFNPTQDYTSVTSVLIAPYPLNLLGTLKLRIASYQLSVNSIDSSVDGNLNILASVPINSGNFGLIMYENTNNIQAQLNTKVLDGIDLEILDDDGNLVNFNNTYWTISLLMSIERVLYVEPNQASFGDVIKQTTQKVLDSNQQDQPLETVNEEDQQAILDEGGDLYVEAPNLEETILPDDLELLLYSKGIR